MFVGDKTILHSDIERVCSVVVDLKNIFEDAPYAKGPGSGKTAYKIVHFTICILFDGLNMKAYARWVTKVNNPKLLPPLLKSLRCSTIQKETKQGRANILPV
ncbi:hypothetical protein P691DRAFT_765194 [Macrolepiota fuliginosa MF-IS2]|uniref:Uncharacterized protein n=1 Tax=Macrolepiota fuliginosa MF-IS2 TaxID=1400762 RepID=A0A9P5X310_9AGAR|nr:hypothetical protein P691DRAFT_765194 [Macrolepiota fuliginosa MF-IS2]